MPKQKVRKAGVWEDLGVSGKVSFPLSSGGPILPPVFLGVANGYQSWAYIISVAKPEGDVAGDLILLTFSGLSNANINTPAGFNALGGAQGSSERVAAFYKYSSGSEPGSYDLTTSGLLGGRLVCTIWRGVDVPIWGGVGGNSLTSPAYIAASGGKTVVGVFGKNGGDLGTTDAVAPWVQRAKLTWELLISQDISSAGTYNPTVNGSVTPSYSATIILPGGGGNYTLLATDAGKVVEISANVEANVTIPQNLFTAGDVVRIRQTGSAQVSVLAGTGVSVSGAIKTKISGDEIWLYMGAINSWSSLLIPISAKADLVAGKVPTGQIPTITAAMVAADVATQAELDTAIGGVGLTVLAHGAVGATETFDPDDAVVHTGVLDSVSVTITIGATTKTVAQMDLYLTQDANGGRVVSWPSNVKWPLNKYPKLSTTGGRTDHIRLLTTDTGVTWFAEHLATQMTSPPTQPNFRSMTSSTSTSNPVVLTKPSGLAVGDLMVFWSSADGYSYSTPSGWTKHGDYSGDSFAYSLIWKFATLADVNASDFSFTRTGGMTAGASMLMAVTGADPVAPIDFVTVGAGVINAVNAYSSIDPSASLGLHVLYGQALSSSVNVTHTPPNGYSEILDTGIAKGSWSSYKQLTNSDPTTTPNGALSASVYHSDIQFIISGGVAGGIDPATPATIADITKIDANNQTGTAYSLVLEDAGKAIELNNAAANTFTIPPNSSVPFPIGTVIEVWQQGAGQVSIAAAAGVTIRSTDAKLKLYGQYAAASLRKRGTDEWVLVGDLVA